MMATRLTGDSAALSRVEDTLRVLGEGFSLFRTEIATIKAEQINQRSQIANSEINWKADLDSVAKSVQMLVTRMEDRDKPRTGWWISMFSALFFVASALIGMNVFFVNSTIREISSPLDARVTGLERMLSDHHDIEERTARSTAADARSEQDRMDLNRRLGIVEDRFSNAIADWRAENSKLEAGFTENETQFKNLTAIAHLLFKKVYGDEFPIVPRDTPMSYTQPQRKSLFP